MKPPTKKLCKKENGIELTKTHFTVGNDKFNYISEYRNEYPTYPTSTTKGNQKIDSVKLRKSHFNLGEDQNYYETSSMEQSKELFTQRNLPAILDQNIKNDLRNSHFVFGNDAPQLMTINQKEYTDKSKQNIKDKLDFKNIERKLRASNYELGNEKTEFISETAAKFKRPNLTIDIPNNNKISTAELQQSHYVFGTHQVPWITTQRLHFGPKKLEPLKHNKILTKTNFILGDDEPTLKSVAQETYIEHPYSKNSIDQNLVNDLRKHHFIFGSDNYASQLTSIYNQKYQNPYASKEYEKSNKLDSSVLKETHWTMGDPSKAPKDHFSTTYHSIMTPKKPEYNPPFENTTFQSSFKISGNGPACYQTENKAKYSKVSNDLTPEELQNMRNLVNNIKSSHFELGDCKNDYNTVNNITYLFNPNLAKNAKGKLDRALINDLRATHYKLGYMETERSTSQRRDYVPYPTMPKVPKDPNLRRSHFSLGKEQQSLDGKSVYMTDYERKPLPTEDD